MPKKTAVSYPQRLRWTAEDARAALDAQARSGLSLESFAQREGLEVQRLVRWARRLGAGPTRSQTRTKPTFVEVGGRSAAVVEIVLRCGVVLRVGETVEPAALRRLVAALEEAAC